MRIILNKASQPPGEPAMWRLSIHCGENILMHSLVLHITVAGSLLWWALSQL